MPDAGSCLCKTNDTVVLSNGDQCALGQFVVVQPRGSLDLIYMAQVEEILQVKGTPNELTQLADGILVQLVSTSQHSDAYSMPRTILTDGWGLLHDIMCTVNVQCNCNDNLCDTSGIRYVYQERVRTDHTLPTVAHRHPSDLILNTAQMRDAAHVQHFRINLPIPDIEEVLTGSVAREVDARRSSTAQKALSSLKNAGLGRHSQNATSLGTVQAS
ncbi:hypothetical protein SERLA73DRAFT_71910 [Serpula lacrymans var. lacrymans S7.3]|uniref:Uncharacterized protein n=1 Tax=Serpula lacrymans var. lacrymans (strain S7.3) TaxID=936435 RepID=F8PTB1_SERL3|nr:hypothetical protein SERLA73DRAFT_71910 [Serpula lacrymans var. lacrymans S7.3]